MADVPENANENCVGPSSELAGKANSCAGCPNQRLCSSGALRGPDPDIARVKDRLRNVRHKVLVLSGKGGVGKSSVSSQLALSLSRRGKQVGLLDIDVCGPSIPRMVGADSEQVFQSGEGWSPVFVNEKLGVMSIAFLLEDPKQAVIWKGPKKNGMIKQFLRDVDWGDLDYLIVDTPPGTSDEHMSIVSYLKETNPDGAVIVTTPQELALVDVRKEINFCKKIGLPVLGVIENMSNFICPKCQKTSQIFKASTGGAEQLVQDFNLRLLGKIPLDSNLTRSCDEGKNFYENFSSTVTSLALESMVDAVLSCIETVNAPAS